MKLIRNLNLGEMLCFHKYERVVEPILIETCLIRCVKCGKEKRVSFQKAFKKGIISHEFFKGVMSDYH